MSAAASAFPSVRLLLCGLDDALTLELRRVLAGGFDALSLPDMPADADSCLRLLQESGARAVLVSDTLPVIRNLMNAATLADLPVIVITRTPDTRSWLDAMEAGAADYAAPPFEREQMRWMLRGTLRR